jgi:antitoxin (DNA-binding transcriptional repressor) of toxin-antitoxin stability system
MGEVLDEVLLGKVKIGDVIHITIDNRVIFRVTPIRGRWVDGDYTWGLQITCSDPASSSHLPPETTRAHNCVQNGKGWYFGPRGLQRGGMVTGIRRS